MSNGFIEKYPATPVDRFKGDLRPKTHPCFYVIILMILWKKSLLVFWSVLMKLWSYKVLNPAWVTSYPVMYKTFHSWFSWNIFVSFMEKEPFPQFYGRFDHFSWIHEVVKFLMIKLCLDVSDVIHANEHT